MKHILRVIINALFLICITTLFPQTLYIDNTYFGLYSLLASIIIYTLNITIKPILVKLTIPLTALTLGLFYPFINIIILLITQLILKPHFKLKGNIIMIFIISIIIELMNIITKRIIGGKK